MSGLENMRHLRIIIKLLVQLLYFCITDVLNYNPKLAGIPNHQDLVAPEKVN